MKLYRHYMINLNSSKECCKEENSVFLIKIQSSLPMFVCQSFYQIRESDEIHLLKTIIFNLYHQMEGEILPMKVAPSCSQSLQKLFYRCRIFSKLEETRIDECQYKDFDWGKDRQAKRPYYRSGHWNCSGQSYRRSSSVWTKSITYR